VLRGKRAQALQDAFIRRAAAAEEVGHDHGAGGGLRVVSGDVAVGDAVQQPVFLIELLARHE